MSNNRIERRRQYVSDEGTSFLVVVEQKSKKVNFGNLFFFSSNDDIVLVSMCQRQDRKRIEKKLWGGCLSIRRVAAYGTTLNETPRGSPFVANSKILERKRENKGISKSK